MVRQSIKYFIEKSLDLDLGTLDGSLGSTKGAINATEGSAIKATTNAFVGDVITFDYSFSTNDYQPYKDFSFFSVNGNTQKIAAVGEDTPNFGNNVGEIEYVLKDSDFENIDESNEVVLGIGIMDALDTIVDSSLSIMNLEISEANLKKANMSMKNLKMNLKMAISTNLQTYGNVESMVSTHSALAATIQ